MQGNYSEVLRWSKILVHLHAQDPNHNNAAAIKALKKISRLTAASGSYDEAMEYLMQGISIARDGSLSKDEVDLLFELSLLYKKRLDINIVRELSIESLRIARSIGYFTKEIDILSLLASIDVLQNQLEVALNLYAQVLASVRAMGDTVREDAIVAEITQVRRLIKLEEDRKRKIFISYNHEDRSFVHRLVSDLKDRELLVWWDEWEIKVGDSIIQKVSDGISESAYLMAVLSPNSVKSEWVQREIGSVLMQQLSVDKNITILPLLLAECDVPVLLREIKFADFRRDYQSGFQSLLAVLVASAS
jgi:tetratricopeptide (TPR) repeat protein